MFNYEEELKKAEETYYRKKQMLIIADTINTIVPVGFIGDSGDIFMSEVKTYEDYLSSLRAIAKTNYNFDFSSYFYGSSNLCIKYKVRHSGKDLIFLVSDYADALEKISKGKCTIAETTRTKTEVVCMVGE